jgi:hypothetical protein
MRPLRLGKTSGRQCSRRWGCSRAHRLRRGEHHAPQKRLTIFCALASAATRGSRVSHLGRGSRARLQVPDRRAVNSLSNFGTTPQGGPWPHANRRSSSRPTSGQFTSRYFREGIRCEIKCLGREPGFPRGRQSSNSSSRTAAGCSRICPRVRDRRGLRFLGECGQGQSKRENRGARNVIARCRVDIAWPMARLAGRALSGGKRQIKPREPGHPRTGCNDVTRLAPNLPVRSRPVPT